MPIDAVIFDVDGTLLRYDENLMFDKFADCLGTDRRSVQRLIARFLAAGTGLGIPELWPPTPDAAPAHWESVAHAFARHAQAAPTAIPALVQTIQGFGEGYAPFPDTLDCLRQMNGLALAVLTNNHVEHMPETLARCGIDPAIFRVILACYRHGFAKPDPAAYLTVARALGVDPARCAFVDDTPGHVHAAHELGMTAWLIDRYDRYQSYPGLRIGTLAEFAEKIAPIAPGPLCATDQGRETGSRA